MHLYVTLYWFLLPNIKFKPPKSVPHAYPTAYGVQFLYLKPSLEKSLNLWGIKNHIYYVLYDTTQCKVTERVTGRLPRFAFLGDICYHTQHFSMWGTRGVRLFCPFRLPKGYQTGILGYREVTEYRFTALIPLPLLIFLHPPIPKNGPPGSLF
jgi:hypothetical protein